MSELHEEDLAAEEVIKAALSARERSVAPFSNFLVGAAVRTDEGKIFTGCNIESASYGLTVCAERVAIWKALSEGEHNFTNLAVAADTETLTPPCGTCRQIIWEFCGDIPVYLVNFQGGEKTYHMADLFPAPFDDRQLS